ncbi:MAG: hypothetical protein ACMUIM_05315 [bacterium]
MPHIFFEGLERRRSTQALLGNIPANGLSGFSSFSSSAPSSISGSYGFPMYCYALGPEWLRGPGNPWGQGVLEGSLYGGIFETSKLPKLKSSTQQSWLNPSYQSPSWNSLNNWTSPIQQPWLTPSPWSSTRFPTSSWTSPIQNFGRGFPGVDLGGSIDLGGYGDLGSLGSGLGIGLGNYNTFGGGIYNYNWIGGTCYAYGGMSSLGGMSGLSGGISKLEKVRKNLLAFFQNKGILTDKQRQRLLSSPFDKA